MSSAHKAAGCPALGQPCPSLCSWGIRGKAGMASGCDWVASAVSGTEEGMDSPLWDIRRGRAVRQRWEDWD